VIIFLRKSHPSVLLHHGGVGGEVGGRGGRWEIIFCINDSSEYQQAGQEVDLQIRWNYRAVTYGGGSFENAIWFHVCACTFNVFRNPMAPSDEINWSF
jgi:hypothetical protein